MTNDSAGAGSSRRRTIGSYSNYRDAERAVDYLADNDFPVEHVAIVGRNLRLVEHVTGRFGWGRAILNGAITGALVGGLVGWVFALFDWFNPAIARGWLIVDGLWFGALVGAALGAFIYAASNGRRDFTSVGAMQAGTYEVVVDEPYADRAIELLRQLAQPASTRDATTASDAAAPGRT
jgi:hypothetical protein